MNEPWVAARSTWDVPYAWYDRSLTESNYLQPMYDRLARAIRSVDENSLIFWEPVCGSGGTLGDGFDHVPLGDKEKSVFSFHSYGPNLVDSLGMGDAVNRALYQQKRLGGAIMVCLPTRLMPSHHIASSASSAYLIPADRLRR